MATSVRSSDPATNEEFVKSLYAGGELLSAGKLVEAKQHLERAHELQPKNEKAQNLLGLAYFKLGLFDRAAEVYELLVRDNPIDPTLRVNLGLVYLKTNNVQRAIQEFETATDLEPTHLKAHNYLGLALAQAGEYAKAREHFVTAGSEAMAEKMTRALSAAAGSAGPQTVRLGDGAPPRPDDVKAAEPPLVSESAITVEPPLVPPSAVTVAAPAVRAMEDEQIEVMSDEEVPLDAEQVSVEAVPEPSPASPSPVATINADWGAQFGVGGRGRTARPAAEEELRFAEDEGPSAAIVDATADAVEVMPVEVMPVEVMPVEVMPVEVMPAEVMPAEVTPTGTTAAEATPMEVTSADVLPADTLSTDSMHVEVMPAEVMPADAPSLEAPPAEVAPLDASLEAPGAPVGQPAPEAAEAPFAASAVVMPGVHRRPVEVGYETATPLEGLPGNGDIDVTEEPPAEASATHQVSAEASLQAPPEVPADPAWLAQPLSQVNLREQPALDMEPVHRGTPTPDWINAPASQAATPAEAAPAGGPQAGQAWAAGAPSYDTTPVEEAAGDAAPRADAPSGYAPMHAQRLLDLGGSSQWVTEPTGNPFNVSPDGLAVTVAGEMLVRLVNLVAVVGSVEVKPEFRRTRGRPTEQSFGQGPSQLQRVQGNGTLYLEPGKRTFHAVDLDEEGAYLREERVFAFEEPIAYENGRLSAEGGLALDLVHLKGVGRVLLQIEGPLKAMPVPPGAPMVIPLVRLVGWFGRVTPRLVGFVGQGAVELTGDGYALLETRAQGG